MFVTVEENVAQWKKIYDVLDPQVVSAMNVSSIDGEMQTA